MLAVLAIALYAALAVVAGGAGTYAVAAHAALAQPVHWGTFRQTRVECEAGRHGTECTVTGTWTAESSGRAYPDVQLDDSTFDPDDVPRGPLRAGYRDFDADGGRPDVVYQPDVVDEVWLGPALVSVIAAGIAVGLAFRWGDARRLVALFRRPSPGSGAVSRSGRAR